jgi:hypothetical protein
VLEVRPIKIAFSISALVVLAGATIGCEDQSSAGGFSLSIDGNDILLYYKPCHEDSKIYSLEVDQRANRGDQWQPTWKIASEPGTTQRLFVYGRVPEGFSETLSSSTVLSGPHELRAILRTDELDEDFVYAVTERLRPDSVLVDGRYISVTDFAERSTCG